jgi:hypothetical protein
VSVRLVIVPKVVHAEWTEFDASKHLSKRKAKRYGKGIVSCRVEPGQAYERYTNGKV